MSQIAKIGQVLGSVIASIEADHEQESWTKKEYVFYRVTVVQSATATPDNQTFGFTREIGGHSAECAETIKKADGSNQTYCKYARSHLTEAEALSLVRKGQGSVYKITQTVERLK